MKIQPDYNTRRVDVSTRPVFDILTPGEDNSLMNREQRKIEAGRRLRIARENAGFKTREMAVSALATVAPEEDYSPSRIGNYENGYRPFGPDEAEHFAKAFRSVAAWLLCLSDEEPVSPDEKALIENYRATDERGKKIISRIAATESPQYIGSGQKEVG